MERRSSVPVCLSFIMLCSFLTRILIRRKGTGSHVLYPISEEEEIAVKIFFNSFRQCLLHFSGSQEMQGLAALEYQMSRNLEALRTRRDSAKYSRTLRGRILNISGRTFAFYCIIRIVSVSQLDNSLHVFETHIHISSLLSMSWFPRDDLHPKHPIRI